jgi:hypothetical protein
MENEERTKKFERIKQLRQGNAILYCDLGDFPLKISRLMLVLPMVAVSPSGEKFNLNDPLFLDDFHLTYKEALESIIAQCKVAVEGAELGLKTTPQMDEELLRHTIYHFNALREQAQERLAHLDTSDGNVN